MNVPVDCGESRRRILWVAMPASLHEAILRCGTLCVFYLVTIALFGIPEAASASAAALACSSQLEVVGAAGRLGSFWLRQAGARPVIKGGVSLGSATQKGCPILVCTPASQWPKILSLTPSDRRIDLCFCGNGLAIAEDCTIIVPHFGILQPGDNPIVTSESPSTILYGRHSESLAKALHQYQVLTTITASYKEIQLHAAQKLLWSSLLWLLSHDSDPPLTVEQVHTDRQADLVKLLQETLPVMEALLSSSSSSSSSSSNHPPISIGSLQDTLNYMQLYSSSIPDAIPSKALALKELEQRNGVWLSLALVGHHHPQPFHLQLLERVAGAQAVKGLLGVDGATVGELVGKQ